MGFEFWDILYRRYASPSDLLEHAVRLGELTGFVEFILKERIEEARWENERRTWELWLHKVWGQSYKEFCDDAVEHAGNQARAMQMDKTDIKHAADTALNTLALFKRGGEPC